MDMPFVITPTVASRTSRRPPWSRRARVHPRRSRGRRPRAVPVKAVSRLASWSAAP